MINVLFICHGSICRSPAAEAIFRFEADKRGLGKDFCVSSMAASTEELGNGIYPPMKRALIQAGVPLMPHESWQVTSKILNESDIVFYMDESNRRILERVFGFYSGINIASLVPGLSEIEDPWYSGRYDLVISELSLCISAYLDKYQKSIN